MTANSWTVRIAVAVCLVAACLSNSAWCQITAGSVLQAAIDRGLAPGGNLYQELSKLDDDYAFETRADAKAVCRALATLPEPADKLTKFESALHSLTALFQTVESTEAPAYEVLRNEGLPHLIRIFKAEAAKDDEEFENDLLFVLKILAIYGTREGAEVVVDAARKPLAPDDYLWNVILLAFADHPHRSLVFDALSNPLPPGFIGVSLLDAANAAALEGDLDHHPFDSGAGVERLKAWLTDADPDHFSHAHSATAALPFIENAERESLLALAMKHSDIDIRMEAAWAVGKLGRESGFRELSQHCLNPGYSERAQRYLRELGREDLIPAEVRETGFRAMAKFGDWLAHPSELGRPPDEMQVIDHRELNWPVDGERKPFWLIRYRVHDTTGLAEDDMDAGLVGGVTWCFFSYSMHLRPPEDAYAIHCYWELQRFEQIEELEVENPNKYAEMLNAWPGPKLTDARVVSAAKLDRQLNYPAERVAVATAKVDGVEGWAVLDGPRSMWYPKSDMPKDTEEDAPLRIHIGRRLLGFGPEADRKKYLVPPRPRPPEQVVAVYEKLLVEAETGSPERREKLLSGWDSPLDRHFDDYVAAVASLRAITPAEAGIALYQRILAAAVSADAKVRSESLEFNAPVMERFQDYIDAMIAADRQSEVLTAFEMLQPYWTDTLGLSELAVAANKISRLDLAERYLQSLKKDHEFYHRREQDMCLLAEVWHRTNRNNDTKALLIDCLQRALAEWRQSKDAQDHRAQFDAYRAKYLQLFPEGLQELKDRNIPESL